MALNRTKVLEAAQKYLAKSQYDKAIAEYEKLVQEDPRDVRTLLKIGDLHTRRARPRDAVDVYNRVADLYAKQGFFLKAVAVYKQILKLVPGDLPTTERLGQMYEELALTNDALNTYELVADAYITQGNLVRAIETMERMVALDEHNVAARIKLAEGLSKADRKQQAAEAFAAGAALLKEQGRMDDYLRVVERQLYHDPENVAISRELAALYLERNDAKRALAKLQPCFKADPRHIPTLEMLAEAFSKLGQAAKTVSVLKEVARLQGEAGESEKRTDTLRRILALDPSDPEAQAAAATLKPRKTGAESKQAAGHARVEVALQSAAKRPSEEAEALDDDDLALVEDDDDEPVLLVEEASAAGPGPTLALHSDPDAWLEEAELLESEERYDEAEALLQRVLHVVPDHEDAHALLKDLYLATDRRVDAVRELLWLSDACTETDIDRAQQYALAAYQLAPNSDVTKNRLRALELEANDSAQAAHQAPADEPVMFVDDELQEPNEPPARSSERPRAQAPRSNERHQDTLDLLDLPVDPDEFDAAPPRPRPRHTNAELASLLEAPLSPTDFARAAKKSPSRRPRADAPIAQGLPAAPILDVAALLDAPIADDFGPRPRVASERPTNPPALDSATGDTGSFDLGAPEFDRSDLLDMDMIAASRGEKQPTHGRAVLEVIDDAPSEPPNSEAEAWNAAARDAWAQAIDDSEPGHPFDADLLEDSPDPTLPSEPIPDLIRQSLRPDDALRAAEAAELATTSPTPLPQARESRLPAPVSDSPGTDPLAVLDALSARFDEPAESAPLVASPVQDYALRLGNAPTASPPPATHTHTTSIDIELDFEPMTPAQLSSAVAVEAAPEAEQPVQTVPRVAPVVLPVALPPEVEETLDEADFFANQGLLEEALEVIQEAMLIYPGIPALAAKLAHYEAQQLHAPAVSVAPPRDSAGDASFAIAQQLAGQLSEAHVPAGHDEMVDVESVFAQFKKGVALQISPDDTETHFDLAIAYKEMGLIDDAIAEFELSSKSTRRACTALTMIAMCYVDRGELQRAVQYFERALASPQQAPAEELGLLFELGNTYENLGQLDKALRAFERVAVRDRTFRNVSSRVDVLRKRGVVPQGAVR